jgi:hypothetical protein
MNKLKPFLFWIVSGVIFLVALVLLLFFEPSSKDGSKTPAQVKEELDGLGKQLSALHKKARGPDGKTPADREFNAEDKKDIDDLTSLWLPTPAWKPVLEGHVQKYDQQLPIISKYLSDRSAVLREPIDAAASDNYKWYQTYTAKTVELLKRMHEKQCISLPQTGTGEPDFEGNASIRSIAGFFTKGDDYPQQNEWPGITLQYRIMEDVVATLTASTATNEVTPITPAKVQREGRAALVSTEWKALPPNSKVIPLTLTLVGPISALLAAEAAMEENTDNSRPIRIVTGAKLLRRAFMAGERKDTPAETASLVMELAVLDLSVAAPVVVVSASVPQARPARSESETSEPSDDGAAPSRPRSRGGE